MGVNDSLEIESMTNANLLSEEQGKPTILGGVIFNQAGGER